MPTVATITADLKKKGTEKARKTYARHGMPANRVFGVSVADLKVIAKAIKGEQQLACELYGTGMMEAMYLAGLVADGSRMTRTQLNQWAAGSSGMGMIAEYTVPFVAVESAHGRELAVQWTREKDEQTASCGWCTYAGIVATVEDAELDLPEIESLLKRIAKDIGGAQNRVRYSMNRFVVAVGIYVKPLSGKALRAAREMGAVSVDMGDTACKVPPAVAEIEKAEAAGKIGRKRKTIRC